MTQKAYAEGLRALVLYTASQQDAVQLAEARGERDELAERVNDLLLPLVKGVGSERSWVLLGTESLQTFGGSGFLQDYPLEQYVRDAKIDTLYEGTTAIQGMDFFFRKIVRDKGQALDARRRPRSRSSPRRTPATAGSPPSASCWARRVDDVQGIVGAMVGALMASDPRAEGGDPRNVYKVGQNTTRLLLAAGDLVIGWLLLRQADVALDPAGRGRRRRTSPSTGARSRRPGSSPGRSCPGCRPSGRSPRRPTTTSWTSTRRRSRRRSHVARPSAGLPLGLDPAEGRRSRA